MVVDNKVFKAMDQNFTRVHQYCKDIANIINAVCFNMFVINLNLTIFNLSFELALCSPEYFHCTCWSGGLEREK